MLRAEGENVPAVEKVEPPELARHLLPLWGNLPHARNNYSTARNGSAAEERPEGAAVARCRPAVTLCFVPGQAGVGLASSETLCIRAGCGRPLVCSVPLKVAVLCRPPAPWTL